MKNLAFIAALLIMAAGVFGFLEPSGLVWVAQHSMTSGVFLAVAAVRVAFGFVLISAASASRAPKGIRILGIVVVIAGITTAAMALVGMGLARDMVGWWLLQGSVMVRLSAALILALGAFVAYACAPARHAA